MSMMISHKLRRILLLTSFLGRLVFSQDLDCSGIQKQAVPKDKCELMVVSHYGTEQGINDNIISQIQIQHIFIDFGRGAIKFQGLKNLMRMKDSKKMHSLTRGMSCLILTVTEKSNEEELFKLIDIMQNFKIAHKHLFINMDSLNTTMFHETNINFKVTINQRGKGMLGVGLHLNE